MYHLWLLPLPVMDNIWLGFSLGRATRCFEAGPPCAVAMCPTRWLGFSVQSGFPEFSNFFSSCSPISISSLLSANTKVTPLGFIFCAIPNLLSTEMVSSYNSRMLSHFMMLKNFSYFSSSCKTYPTASASPSVQLCQERSVFLTLPSALLYSYNKAQRWKQPGTCRGSRHQNSSPS